MKRKPADRSGNTKCPKLQPCEVVLQFPELARPLIVHDALLHIHALIRHATRPCRHRVRPCTGLILLDAPPAVVLDGEDGRVGEEEHEVKRARESCDHFKDGINSRRYVHSGLDEDVENDASDDADRGDGDEPEESNDQASDGGLASCDDIDRLRRCGESIDGG